MCNYRNKLYGTAIVPVTVTATGKMTIDAKKSTLEEGAKIIGLSIRPFVANSRAFNADDTAADVVDNTILQGGQLVLKNKGGTPRHVIPLNDLVWRQADEPFLGFHEDDDFDLWNDKSEINLSASGANITTNVGRVIEIVVRYLRTC